MGIDSPDRVSGWAESLRKHVAELRRRRPLPGARDLTALEQWQRRVNAGVLVRWLDECRAGFHAPERFVDTPRGRIPAGPLLVFTSDLTGLLASQSLMGAEPPLVCLLDEEYEALPAKLADRGLAKHIRFYSRFERLDAVQASVARQAHPMPNGHEYWLHREGTIVTQGSVCDAQSLWSWNGTDPELLVESFDVHVH